MSWNSTLKSKKSLRDYCQAKRKRDGRPIFEPRSQTLAPELETAVERGPKPQAQKQAIKRAPATPRKALRRQSKRMEREMDAYYGQRIIFLQRYPICGACLVRDISPAPSAQIHHQRGRLNKLLRDERFWLAVCAPCHEFIHEHPADARELGLLSSATDFNRFPG